VDVDGNIKHHLQDHVWKKGLSLSLAVMNRPQVAQFVHGTMVALTRLVQGKESEIDNKTFYQIIEGTQAAFGAKRQIHSSTSVTQAGKQHVPVSANLGAMGRHLMTRKKSYKRIYHRRR
jgi:hypothetical protein